MALVQKSLSQAWVATCKGMETFNTSLSKVVIHFEVIQQLNYLIDSTEILVKAYHVLSFLKRNPTLPIEYYGGVMIRKGVP